MAVKRKYRLNLRNYGNLPAIMLSQYDEGYALEFEIRDGTEAASDLSAYTVTLKGTRADTLAYSFAGTIATNVLTFVIDTTMTACAGRGTAEIAIKDTANDVLFATFNMPVFVERAAVPEGSIDADVERAQEIAEQVQEIVDNAAAAVSGAAEKWATGQINGTDVPSTDPTYENNAKYYAEQAEAAAESIGIDATLTQSGKAADAKKTGDEISDLKEDLTVVTGSEKIVFTTGYYIKTVRTAGSTVIDLTPQSNSSLAYAIVPCSEGDELIINARGWTNGRLWAFLDSNNVLISVEQASITGVNLVITAPPNTAKCVLNSFVSGLGDCFKGLTVPVYAKQTDASISGIESQICNVYHRYEQGTINSQGVPVANANTMRSIDFVPLENIKYIKIGVNNYIYLRLYDMYGYYVGMISSLGYGQGYPEFITYDSIKASYPNAYNLKITISGSSAVTPSTLANTGLEMVYYKTLPQTVIVDINGSGDYTSILKALKETPPTTRVYVKQGTYNEITEYTDYYGSEFWTNYAGYGGLQDDFLRGYFVSAGRVLEFESGAVVECLFDGSNTTISQYFCPLATGYDATIIGGYIKYSHCRYGLHDDNAIYGGTNVFDGIIFDGTNIYYGNHIGGGMGKANTYYLKNLVFIDDGLTANDGDLYYHNNIDASAENRLFMINCYGDKSATFLWYGNSTKKTRCVASGNHFKSIACQAHTIAPYDNENIELIAFNNELTA